MSVRTAEAGSRPRAAAQPVPSPRPQQSRRRRRGRDLGYWPYLAPGLIGFAVIFVVPFFQNLYISLHSWKGGWSPLRWVGLGNYEALLSDERFWGSFRNSIFMIVAMVIIPMVIGLIIAATLFDYVGRKFNGLVASFLRATYYLPQILPIAVAGIVWNWILNARTGAVNAILTSLGVTDPPNWLGDPRSALPSVMIMLIWAQIGYPVVVFMSGLQRVDPELYEAAELDGAGWLRRFRFITIPQIKPETWVITLTCTIAALKVFGPIFVLTKGGPESSTLVPSYYSYQNFFSFSKIGYGAAVANVLTLVVIVVGVIILALQNRSERRELQGAVR